MKEDTNRVFRCCSFAPAESGALFFSYWAVEQHRHSDMVVKTHIEPIEDEF